MIAVGEPCCEFSQVALADRLTAHGAERPWPGRPAVHQYEFHCPSPNEEQSKRHLACTSARARRNFSAMKSTEGRRSITPSQPEEPSSTIERSFGTIDLRHRDQG